MPKNKKKKDHNTITWHCPDKDLRKRLDTLAASVGLSRSKLLTNVVGKMLEPFEKGDRPIVGVTLDV